MVLGLEWLAKHPELGFCVRVDEPVEDRSIQLKEVANMRTLRALFSSDQFTLPYQTLIEIV